MFKRTGFLICFLGLMHAFIYAGDDTGKAGFDFLRTDMGARPASMAGAFGSVTGDLHSILYNPAGLAGAEHRVTFTYLNHFLDIKSGFLGYNHSIPGAGQLAVGISYINYGEFRRTSVLGEDLGSFMPGDLSVNITYADSLPIKLRYGATLKYVQSSIDEYTASAVAADLGLIYVIPSQKINIGLSLLNLGKSVKAYVDEHERLPLTYRLGISKELAHLPLLINLNLIKYQYDNSNLVWGLYWALGGEFTVTNNFLLRWGYHSRGSEEKVGADSDRFAGVSLGMGIRFKRYRIDYGYSSYGALGNMHNLTVTFCY